MDFDDYQRQTASTAAYPGAGTGLGFVYTALGMNGEAGEVAEHAKKMLRDDGGELTPTRRAQVLMELGDVLWYLARACTEADASLEEVAGANLAKLKSRKMRGVLGGSGDTR